MARVGTAFVPIHADLSPLRREVKEAFKKQGTIGKELDSATKASHKNFTTATRDADNFSRSVDKASNSSKLLGRNIFRANANITFLSRAFKLLKWPAIITGAGLAAQAIGSLSAAVVGLTGALAPLTGLLAAYPAALTTFAQVAGVVAVAGVKDLTDALGGNAEALKRLTPEARKFLDTLKGFKPQWDTLKKTVQGNLFGGLEQGVKRAAQNLPVLQKVLGRTATTLGNLGERAGKLLGSKGFGKDFAKIGTTNATVLGRFGRAAINVADALRNVMVVARPLVGWIGKMAEKFSESVLAQSRAGRESGRMAHFFDQTRKITERLGSILFNLADGFYQIGKAAAPLGRDLLATFDEATKSFSNWTKSTQGRNDIASYFERARPAVFEFFRLVRDLGGGLLDLSNQPGLAPLIKQIRVELVPVLTDMIKHTTQAFGPHLITLLTNLGKLLGTLAGTNGPLVIWADSLSTITKFLNFMFQHIPGLQSIVTNFIGLAAAWKTLSFLTPSIGRGLLKRLAIGGAAEGIAGGTAAAGGGAAASGITGGLVGSMITSFKQSEGALAITRALATGIKKAIPGVFAAYAIGDTIKTAIGGNVEGAAFKAGGALAGAIAGGLAFGLPGALIGAGVGEQLGPVLQKIFGGEKLAAPIAETFADKLKNTLGKQLGVTFRSVGIGGKGVTLATDFGRLLFNPLTGRVIKVSTDKLKKVLGDNMQQVFAFLSRQVQDPNGKLKGGWTNAFNDLMAITKTKFGKMVGLTKISVQSMNSAIRQGADWKETVRNEFDTIVNIIKSRMERGKISVEKGQRQINRALEQEAAILGTGVVLLNHADTTKKTHGSVAGKGPGAQEGAAIVPGMASGDRHTLSLNGVPIALVESGEQISVLNRTATEAMMGINSMIPRFKGGGLPSFTNSVGGGAIGANATAANNLMVLMAMQLLKKHKGTGNIAGLMREASRMDALHQPYLWGGGHSGFSRNGPWDCSGAISQLLHGAGVPISSPMVSGGFMNYGLEGAGGNATIWANPEHVWMTINGKGISTSHENPGGGFGWVSYNSRPGFVKRHPDLSAAVSGLGPNNKKGQPLAKGAQRGGIVGLKGGGQPRLSSFLKHGSHWLHPSNPMTSNQGHTLLWQAGMPDSAAGQLTTVLPDESGGDWHSVNRSSGASGVWQILGKPSGAPPGSLFDPVVNSIDAKLKWEQAGHSFSPWPTYPGSGPTGHILREAVQGKASSRGKTKLSKKPGQQGFNIKALPISKDAKSQLRKLIATTIPNLQSLAEQIDEFAQRAGSLGAPLPGGKSELDYLADELNTLFTLRDRLALVYRVLQRALEIIQKRIDALNNQIKKLPTGDAKKAAKKQRAELLGIQAPTQGKLGEVSDALKEVQGIPTFADFAMDLKTRPSVGVLGGRIFDVQQSILEAQGSVDGSAGDDELNSLKDEVNVKLATALAISQAQYPILKQIPQLIGGFRRGRVSGPGGLALVGESGPELANLARNGAVKNAEQTADLLNPDVRVVINGHVLPFEDHVGDLVEIYVNGILQKEGSLQKRRM